MATYTSNFSSWSELENLLLAAQAYESSSAFTSLENSATYLASLSSSGWTSYGSGTNVTALHTSGATMQVYGTNLNTPSAVITHVDITNGTVTFSMTGSINASGDGTFTSYDISGQGYIEHAVGQIFLDGSSPDILTSWSSTDPTSLGNVSFASTGTHTAYSDTNITAIYSTAAVSDAFGHSVSISGLDFSISGDPSAINYVDMLHSMLSGNDVAYGSIDADELQGFAGNDTIDGGAGSDIASYTGNRANFTVTQSGTGFIVTDTTGALGTDTLTNIERLVFADSRIALDVIGGNAGTTAKILGAVFGVASVSNSAYVGIGLSYLDGGMSYQDLMLLALNARLGAGFSDADEVNLLYQNLVGLLPSAADLDYWIGTLTSGQFTQASLAVMAADLDLNATNINLAGLAQTGIEYI